WQVLNFEDAKRKRPEAGDTSDVKKSEIRTMRGPPISGRGAIREISLIRGLRGRQKKAEKRLHKRQSALYKCAHEHPTPLYFTRPAACWRLGELAAKRGGCPGFLARARHASCAGRESAPYGRISAPRNAQRNCSSGFRRANRYAITKRVDISGQD